ncbi:MAG: tetratricopeptide repeat protein, partial [Bacteroidales bacterium]
MKKTILMKTTFLLLILFCSLFSVNSFAQNQHKIDSLQNELKKFEQKKKELGNKVSPLMDSSKANIFYELYNSYHDINKDSAMDYSKKCLAVSEKIGFKNGIGNGYNGMGAIANDLGNTQLSLEYHQDALNIRKEIGDKKGMAESYCNLAWVTAIRLNYIQAIEYYKVALKLEEEIADKKKMAQTYRKIGNIYHLNLDDYSKALEFYQKALKMNELTGNKNGIAVVHYLMGYCYLTTGDYPEAITNGLLALKNYEEIGDQIGKAMSFEIIGKVYDSQRNYPEAISNFKKEIDICRQIGDKNRLSIAYCKIGETYLHQGNYSDALTNEAQALKLSEECHDTNWIGLSHIISGDVYEKQANYSEALKNYLPALEIFEKLHDKECLAMVGTRIGKVYEKQGKLEEALHSELKGLAFAREINFREEKKNSYEELALINTKLGNYKAAYENEVLFKQMYDSIYNKENEKKLTSLQMQYDFDKKVQADSIQHASENRINLLNLHKQKVYTGLGISGFILVILLLFFVYRNYTNQRKATAEMAIARQRAEQSEKFKEQFLANMSHEIRTPMNAVMGMTNLVMDSPLNEKQRFYLEGIRKSGETLLYIINDILDLSKIEAGKMEMENIDFSVSEVLEQVKQTLQHKAEEKGLQLIVDRDGNVPDVLMGDPVRLNQVLMNLAGNAIKFTEKGSVAIEIKKGASASAIRFSINDTGIGIPEDKLQTVFESFSQAKTSDTRTYGGTGLGLTISKQLVELMDGKISVESKEGSGTTFSFEINFPFGSPERLKEQRSAEQIEGSILNGLKILLADDNEYNRIVTHDTLTSKANVEIKEVTNGKEAIDLLSQQDFDVVLMDVQMPLMDGYEATR